MAAAARPSGSAAFCGAGVGESSAGAGKVRGWRVDGERFDSRDDSCCAGCGPDGGDCAGAVGCGGSAVAGVAAAVALGWRGASLDSAGGARFGIPAGCALALPHLGAAGELPDAFGRGAKTLSIASCASL